MPSPTPVLESVLDLSRFRAFEAFWTAMEASTAGCLMSEELGREADARTARKRGLRAGISLLAQWQNESGDEP